MPSPARNNEKPAWQGTILEGSALTLERLTRGAEAIAVSACGSRGFYYSDEEIARMCGPSVYEAYMRLIDPDRRR